jgi:hypothetical protein
MTRHPTRLAGVMTAAAVLLLGACADEADGPIVDGAPVPTDEPTGPPTGSGATVSGDGWEGVVLDAGLDWLQLDDGTLVDQGVRSFVPDRDDVARFEAGLPEALATATNPSGEQVTVDDLTAYVRQYTGVEGDGHRQLVVAALCDPDAFPEWRSQWIEVMDGGACFWDATMDLASGAIIRFSFHGSA